MLRERTDTLVPLPPEARPAVHEQQSRALAFTHVMELDAGERSFEMFEFLRLADGHRRPPFVEGQERPGRGPEAHESRRPFHEIGRTLVTLIISRRHRCQKLAFTVAWSTGHSPADA